MNQESKPQKTLCGNIPWVKHLLSVATKTAIYYLPKCLHHLITMIHIRFMRLTLFVLIELLSSLFSLNFSRALIVNLLWVKFAMLSLVYRSNIIVCYNRLCEYLGLADQQFKRSVPSAIGQPNKPGVEFWAQYPHQIDLAHVRPLTRRHVAVRNFEHPQLCTHIGMG